MVFERLNSIFLRIVFLLVYSDFLSARPGGSCLTGVDWSGIVYDNSSINMVKLKVSGGYSACALTDFY